MYKILLAAGLLVVPAEVVRPFGEASTGGGATWSPDFDFTYRKTPKP